MKNSGMYRGPDMREGRSRREILGAAALLPLAYLLGSSGVADAAETDGIVMRDGWILRRDDLGRLGIA